MLDVGRRVSTWLGSQEQVVGWGGGGVSVGGVKVKGDAVLLRCVAYHAKLNFGFL